MQSFFAPGPARFAFRADFIYIPFANVSFFDRDGERILFHLSLRSDENLAVCNKRAVGEDAWAREIRKPMAFPDRPVDVEILFDAPKVRVRIDGVEIFQFGRRLTGARFPDIAKIGAVDLQGAIPLTSVKSHETPIVRDPTRPLELSNRFELCGRLPKAKAAAAIRLEIDGFDAASEAIVYRERTSTWFRGILPGRVWQGVPHNQPIKARLCLDDAEHAKLSIDRRQLVQWMTTMLTEVDPKRDLFLAAQLVEHARFAGVLETLDPNTHGKLFALASALSLEAYLTSPASDTAPGPAADRPEPLDAKRVAIDDKDAAQIEAIGALAPKIREAETRGELASILRDDLDPPTDNKTVFYAALAEPYCAKNAGDLVIKRAKADFDQPIEATKDHWTNLGLLPFFLYDGRHALLVETVEELAHETWRSLMTSPLAWTVRQAIDFEPMDEKDRETLVYTFMLFVDERRKDFWGRTPCVHLIETTIALIVHRHRFSDHLPKQIDEFALRTYGLSTEFWRRLDESGADLSLDLKQGAAHFGALVNHEIDPAIATRAFDFFARQNNFDVYRFERERMLASGLDTLTVQEMLASHVTAREAALRRLAAPDQADAGPEIHALAREAIMSSKDLVDQAPYYLLQNQVGTTAQEILNVAYEGQDPMDAMTQILRELPRLSNRRSKHVGLGLGLSLLAALKGTKASRSIGTLTDHLTEALKRSPQWLETPAVRMGSFTLASHAGLSVLEGLGLAEADIPKRVSNPIVHANPLFDTVIVVVSCEPYLHTRIPEMRSAWVDRLVDLGVPCIVVVGNGDGRFENGVVHLDAPDDYEGLPQKVLTAIDWVRHNTNAAYMMKIDDDCFLNSEAFFSSLSYKKFDYYGHVLHRVRGQMDRAWHTEKSQSDRGRLELDKSPEPSIYCDGGFGYTLSRTAMDTVLDMAEQPDGRALIQASFMEDKVVGDLLALDGIEAGNEDYRVTMRRQGAKGGIAVPRWVNGFDPSQTAPVKLVHLDTIEGQRVAAERLGAPGLYPKKIWPTFLEARIGEQTNALEAISANEKLSRARDAEVAAVACMRNEMFMLPHFLDHYRKLGVEAFVIADNCSDDGTLEYLAGQPDVAAFSVETDYRTSHYGVAWQQALLAHFRQNRWSLVADADELLVWQRPDTRAPMSLPDLLATWDFADVDAARIFMLDLYPQGQLSDATFASGQPFVEAGHCDRDPFLTTSFFRGPYSNAPTWTSALRHRLIPGSRNDLFVAQKIALLKYHSFMRLSDGLHYVSGVTLSQREMFFGHFKYNADFRRKAKVEVARKQHFNDAEEYRKYLALVSEGRDRLYDPAISVPWTSSDFVRDRLG